jgi:hypothetical protein
MAYLHSLVLQIQAEVAEAVTLVEEQAVLDM